MRSKKFLRRNTGEYLKLGSKRKKLRKWSKPKGRDNKMRLKMKGYPRNVELGYKGNSNDRGKISGKETILINNISDINKIGKNNIALIGRLGKKKKLEVAKISIDKKIEFVNFNPHKYLKLNLKKTEKIEDKNKVSKEEKKWN